MNQIPKVIHYCWFGRNPLPPMAERCIASWRKFLPDYEIKEWNEDNFDVTMNAYIDEAYNMKKFAFVSDFARFWILYHHGGVYFDVDVEVIKPMDDILAKGPFMGLEDLEQGLIYRDCKALPAAGLGMAAYPKMPLLEDLLRYYNNKHFISLKGKAELKTVVLIVTDVLLDRGGTIDGKSISVCSEMHLYPSDYFNPKSLSTGVITLTDNTRSIHHFAGTWVDRKKVRGLKRHWIRLKNLMLRLRLSVKRAFKCKK